MDMVTDRGQCIVTAGDLHYNQWRSCRFYKITQGQETPAHKA